MCEAMKLLKHVSIILAFAVCWFMACESVTAQESPTETQIIKGDANSCELNSLYLDMLTNEYRANNERVFVIARLGRGETSRALILRRLDVSRMYLNGRIKNDRILFAEGERVKGEGRVEFYLGSKLFLVSLAERGRNVCLTCCDDHIPPTKRKRVKRRRG